MKRGDAGNDRRGQTGFSQYDNRRFSVFLDGLAASAPLQGTARFERDDVLGSILRIALDGDVPGAPDICVSEKHFGGLIVRDSRYGCDFSLILISDVDASAQRRQSSVKSHRRATRRPSADAMSPPATARNLSVNRWPGRTTCPIPDGAAGSTQDVGNNNVVGTKTEIQSWASWLAIQNSAPGPISITASLCNCY
jgi:hypothetical protein